MTALLGLSFVYASGRAVQGQAAGFRVEEATIDGLHRAIQQGQTTCTDVVQAYIARAKAYNGMCTALVTRDGEPLAPATGRVRAGSPLVFPTQTVPVASVLPDFDQYDGPPIAFGRMEPTVSDPSVQQQFGMRIAIPDAGQVNALETLNIRGERSVTCKGDFDRAPSAGPLPAGAPAVCEAFRKQPDALEQAAELDKQYGNKPNLQKLPLYCVAVSVKNRYDAKDMRATGGNDVNFAMDAPPRDHPAVAALRDKGAIIYAVAIASASSLTEAGPAKAKSIVPNGNFQDGAYSGQPCNPYDTARVPRGSSNGSAVSVAANLAACSICEQTSASCKGPASRNDIVSLLTTKGITMDGGLGHQQSGDREGIHCRTVRDAVQMLDAVKAYDSQDGYSIPKALVPKESFTSYLVADADLKSRPLKGLRIGVVREFMVKHTRNDEAISDQLDKEIKTVLRDRLGAELVESVDPLYPDDLAIPNMKYTFRDAIAEIMPHWAPEVFWLTSPSGNLEFAVPGFDVRTTDYAVALALGKAPLSDRLNLRRISNGGGLGDPESAFAWNVYLSQRGDTRVKDWASFVANTKFRDDAQRAGSENAVRDQDPRQDPGTVSYLKMQEVLRLIVLNVMHKNNIDVFVNPEHTLPPPLLGGPGEPPVNNRPTDSCCAAFTALLGGPEIAVPAGYTQTSYEPRYVLSADKKQYRTVTGAVQSRLPHPMPISLMFWAGPGSDTAVIKAASAYETATHHRVPPPSFGPVPGESTGTTRQHHEH
jgi:Asp-tRNA(Asn)/Glu-tRNA(Gln) amidotransferase A subunit family amidase